MRSKDVEDLEIVISRAIKYGVIASAVIMLAGLMMFIITGVSGYPGDTFPTNLPAIFEGIITLKPYAIMMTGLFLLILTPVIRVGVSIIVFAKEKDYIFVKITLAVFIILIISFLLGKVE